MNEGRLYRRIVRRERHRSRSLAVSVVLILFVLGLAYVATEAVLAALRLAPLLVAPDTAVSWIAADSDVELVIAGGVAIVGLLLLIVAVTPARRARHELPTERMAVVVDDAVLAGAIARVARKSADVAPDRVRADVAVHRARVFITPTSGLPVDRAETTAAVDGALERLDARPRIRSTVSVSQRAVVGS